MCNMYNIEIYWAICEQDCVILCIIYWEYVYNIVCNSMCNITQYILQYYIQYNKAYWSKLYIILLTILLNIACNFVYNIDVDIVHIVHIARVLINCTFCQYCTTLLDIAHKIAQVWFADGARGPGVEGIRRDGLGRTVCLRAGEKVEGEGRGKGSSQGRMQCVCGRCHGHKSSTRDDDPALAALDPHVTQYQCKVFSWNVLRYLTMMAFQCLQWQ